MAADVGWMERETAAVVNAFAAPQLGNAVATAAGDTECQTNAIALNLSLS